MMIKKLIPSLVFLLCAALCEAQGADVLQSSVQKGLQLLYQGQVCNQAKFCLNNEETLHQLTHNAIDFKDRFTQLIKNAKTPIAKWKKISISEDVSVEEISFPSLYQRAAGHPSNQVVGLYYSKPEQKDCFHKVPTTILIHKITNNIRNEKMIAQTAAEQGRGSVLILYLPEYGPRKSASGSFITGDQKKFEENILQALVDVHQAHHLLRSLPEIDTENIGLAGFSLGGIMSLISAGIDPIFSRYFTVVGGGDLAHLMSYKYRHPEDTMSPTALALKNVNWTTDEARYFLSRFDPITWGFQPKNKSITMANAVDDELLDKQKSIEKLFNQYVELNPNSKLRLYPGTHVLEVLKIGIVQSFQSIIRPLFQFIGTSNIKCDGMLEH